MTSPRQKLRARREALRTELERRRGPKRRRRWLLLVLLLLLLLLLLRNCSCTEDPPPGEALSPLAVGEPVVVPPEPTQPTGRIDRQDRPGFESDPPQPLPWIGAFRLQVAARGPRLAECFVGAPRPGTLKWTTSVEPSRGRVSDHTLEPTLLSDPLTQAQRACVIAVLSEPTYHLEGEDERSTPSRVAMVIEF